MVYIKTVQCCHFTIIAFPAANIPPISGESRVVGGSVRIRCSGSGDPEPAYMWFKEDEDGKYQGYHNIIKMLQVYLYASYNQSTTCTLEIIIH